MKHEALGGVHFCLKAVSRLTDPRKSGELPELTEAHAVLDKGPTAPLVVPYVPEKLRIVADQSSRRISVGRNVRAATVTRP